MVFVLQVAIKAAEVTFESKASTFLAFVGVDRIMLFVCVFAFATRSPDVDVETLPSREPPLADFFRSTWNKSKVLARTLCAISFRDLLGKSLLVSLKEMSTEAFRLCTNSEAVAFASLTDPCYIDSGCDSFLSMLDFPSNHLFRSWSRTKLLHALQDGCFVRSLC